MSAFISLRPCYVFILAVNPCVQGTIKSQSPMLELQAYNTMSDADARVSKLGTSPTHAQYSRHPLK